MLQVHRLTNPLIYRPAESAFRLSAKATGAELAECFDILGRTMRTMTLDLVGLRDAVDTEYDVRGNVTEHASTCIEFCFSQLFSTKISLWLPPILGYFDVPLITC